MESSARWSRCRRYRTALVREWDRSGARVAFVGLNPSTADGSDDDPTSRRCIAFARREGAGSLVLLNLYGFRATRPAELWSASSPVGPGTDRVMARELRCCTRIIACWGAVPARARARVEAVVARLRRTGLPVSALGFTRDGHPRHPLYLRKDTPLIAWPAQAFVVP